MKTKKNIFFAEQNLQDCSHMSAKDFHFIQLNKKY